MSMKWKHKGREFESIGYQLKDKKTMIIYGAGDYACLLYTSDAADE